MSDQPPLPDSTQQPAPAQPKDDQKTYRQIAAYNIDRLSEINRQLPKMLTWFATALTQLTNAPIPDTDSAGQPDTLAARQATFRKYALYVGHINEEIREELTKQINELERQGVIPKRHPKYRTAEKGEKEGHDPERGVKNGGYGEWDVGVLNARASGGLVGGEHVLDRVQAILEELRRRVEGEGEGGGEEMVVDG